VAYRAGTLACGELQARHLVLYRRARWRQVGCTGLQPTLSARSRSSAG